MPHVIPQDLEKAAVRGEPSHVWRAGQQRRFAMLKDAAGERLQGSVLVDGCGVGTYLARLVPVSGFVTGLDIEYPRVVDSSAFTPNVLCAAGEYLPYKSESMDVVFSHEVLEHVQDDAMTISEMVRVLKPGGLFIFIEHVRPKGARAGKFFDFANPSWTRIADGCNLNRRTDEFLRQSGFSDLTLREGGVFRYGTAKKSNP